MKRTKAKLAIFIATIAIIGLGIYFGFPYIFGSTAYPLEYQDKIVKYSTQYNLEPNWVAAVIYSESRFNPKATSRAGARGLMQVMPATGKSIANRLGEGGTFTTDKLYDPEVAIRYGCYYLRYLLDSYGNDKTLALIGYNGGGAAVNRYKSRQVIARETTGYIRIVPAAENMYKSLYGEWYLNPAASASTNNSPVTTAVKSTGPKDSLFNRPTKTSFSVSDFWKALLYAGTYDKSTD